MLYGLLLESARQYIVMVHGDSVWKCIVHELQLPSETFDIGVRYDGKLLFHICECKDDPLIENATVSVR